MEPSFAQEILAKYPDVLARCYLNTGIRGYHFLFVGTFFALSFYLVYFRFDAFTPVVPTAQKVKRNKIYKVCGAAMLCAFVAIGVLAFLRKEASIFRPETVAVMAFAIAWLVKGRMVLKDQEPAAG